MISLSPFFSQNETDSTIRGIDNNELPPYMWFISADSIFKSNVTEFKDYARIFGIEFCISRFSLFDGSKSSDSAVTAEDVKVYISSGIHSPMIQGRMAKGVIIPKITIKKVASLSGKLETLENKEFSKCVIQSFSRIGEQIAFTFRYSSYSDSYTDIQVDGTKGGTAATKIDLVTWEIEDS
ncbi:MAG: hypothetical protein LBS23_03495 [Holosporaceae bacterium]|nr:hypothetical protein [Holosporaceae bacterium]